LSAPEAASPSLPRAGTGDHERDLARRTRLYVFLVFAVALGFLGLLIYLQITWTTLPQFSIWGALLFAALGLFADRYTIRIGNGFEVSASFIADFLGAAILGPLVGALVASASALGQHKRGEGARTLFYISAFVICGGVTGLVFWVVVGRLGVSGWVLAFGGIAAGLLYHLLNWLLFSPIAWLRRGIGPAELFQEAFQPFLPYHLFFLFISLGLVYLYRASGPPVFALFLLPVVGLVWAFRSFSHERDLSRRLERFSLEMAAGMITALDLKDNYTAQHSAAVAQYSFDIARAMKLSSRECNLAHLAGLLHDLGKISVPDDVLNCPTKLDADQWDLVQGHSVAGQKILGNMNEFKELATIVLYHHERYDGGGYPDRVSGEGIPLLSRIVSVADSYSAMISDRPYRARLPWETAKREIIEKSGQQFDPMVAGRFIEVLETHDDHYRRADQVDFHVQFQKVRFLRDLKWSSEQP
jgi:putative nucleotidyltransferase with HDIG domain